MMDSVEYTNGTDTGPDQIRPAEHYHVVNANEAVKLRIEQTGMAAMTPISVPTLLRQAADDFPNRVALAAKSEKGAWKETTYRQYYAQVRTCAKAFLKLGLERHHSVCVIGFNAPEWIIANLAAIFAGGVASGVYTTNSPEACHHCAEITGANIFVVEDRKQLEKILEIRDRLPHLKAIVQYEGVPHVAGVLSWEELMRIGDDEPDLALENALKSIAINECCSMLLTSGTVGQPKAVMMSHDNLVYNAKATGDYLKLQRGVETIVSFLPLSHIAAQILDIYIQIMYSATTYFADKDALKGSLVKTLHEVGPTIFVGVPRVFEKISEKLSNSMSEASFIKRHIGSWAKGVGLQHYLDKMNGKTTQSLQYKLADALVFQKVKVALGLHQTNFLSSAAAPMSLEVMKSFWALGMPLQEVYGMTELTGAQTSSVEGAQRLESVGKTVVGSHTKIDSPDADGQGEVMAKGRHVFMGYLNDAANTQASFDADAWFRTGDLGKIDADGFVYITGRVKELIITSGGENVLPVLIEQTIKEELPCVSQAVLIGDKRKYLTVLLTLKTDISAETELPLDTLTEVALKWCREVGSSATTVTEVLAEEDGKVYAALQEGIDRANLRAISNATRVQKFAVLPRDLALASGELGPTLKLKRNVIVQNNTDVIESLYT